MMVTVLLDAVVWTFDGVEWRLLTPLGGAVTQPSGDPASFAVQGGVLVMTLPVLAMKVLIDLPQLPKPAAAEPAAEPS